MRGIASNLAGQKFGRLMAVRPTHKRVCRSVVWECLCECGAVKLVSALCLNTAKVRSCGCLNLDSRRETHTKHGMCDTPTYQAWKDMKARCLNPKLANWEQYGGRGIAFCERWEVFENFIADVGVKPDGLTLERIENDGNYEPGNVRWATRHEQARNTRRNRYVEVQGRRQTVSEWARERGVSRHLIRDRLDAGIPPFQAIMEVGANA